MAPIEEIRNLPNVLVIGDSISIGYTLPTRALLKGKEDEIKDGIGDSFVTLIILAQQLGYSPTECLQLAYDEIADRKGKTIDGVFVKDE